MTRKTAGGLATLIVCVTLVLCVAFMANSSVMGAFEPYNYADLDSTISLPSGLASFSLALVAIAPYLLWRSRAMGIVASIVCLLFVAGQALLFISGPIHWTTIACVASAAVGLVGALWYLELVRRERRDLWKLFSEDGVALTHSESDGLNQMSASVAEAGMVRLVNFGVCLWLLVLVAGLIGVGLSVNDAQTFRQHAIPVTGVVSPQVLETPEGEETPSNTIVVADFPDARCEPIMAETLEKMRNAQVTELDLLVDPSSGRCEVLAEASEPMWPMLIVGIGLAFSSLEVLRRVQRRRALISLHSVERAVPLWAVSSDGTIMRQQLSMLDERIALETDTFIAAKDVEPRTSKNEPSDSLSAARRYVPLARYLGASEMGFRHANSHLLHITNIEQLDSQHRSDQVPDLEQEQVLEHGSEPLHTQAEQKQTESVSGGDEAINRIIEETLRQRSRGGPYYLVPQAFSLDKVLVVDPEKKTALIGRLLGGKAGEGVADIDLFDLLFAWWRYL